MSRKFPLTDFNFCLDALLLLIFLALATTSVIIDFVFPPEVRAEGWLLWGKTYGEWSRSASEP
jgi:hypothetical protein